MRRALGWVLTIAAVLMNVAAVGLFVLIWAAYEAAEPRSEMSTAIGPHAQWLLLAAVIGLLAVVMRRRRAGRWALAPMSLLLCFVLAAMSAMVAFGLGSSDFRVESFVACTGLVTWLSVVMPPVSKAEPTVSQEEPGVPNTRGEQGTGGAERSEGVTS